MASCIFNVAAGLASTTTAGLAPTPRVVQRVHDLTAADFQHPLDRDAARARRFLGPIEAGVRRGFESLEDVYLVDNLASGVLCGPSQLPEYHEMLTESCRLLNLPSTPQLYIRQSAAPNAYTLAIQGRAPFVVVTTAAIDLLTPLELQAVIAHELGHLKCEHGLLIALANVLTILAPEALQGVAQTSLLRWQRAAELSCDRAALMVVQDPRAMQSVLMKLCGASSKTASRMNLDAFLEQARTYERVSGFVGRQARKSKEEMATHPLPILRARELERWASSAEYAQLIGLRGQPVELRAADRVVES